MLGAPPLLLAFSVGALGVWLNGWGHAQKASKADAIVVFGAQVRADGRASSVLRARTRHAFDLWQRGLAPRIVCTGGVGEHPPAEAEVEAALLRDWGVPETAILIENRSISTRENAVFAAKLLPRGARVVAVSDPFHLYRARMLCERVGLRASCSPALGAWPQLSPQKRAFYCVREAILVVRDSLI